MSKLKVIHVPPGLGQQLRLTAKLAGVAVDEVVLAAFRAWTRLEPGTQLQLLGEFWYRGPQGEAQPARPSPGTRNRADWWSWLGRVGLARWLGKLLWRRRTRRPRPA